MKSEDKKEDDNFVFSILLIGSLELVLKIETYKTIPQKFFLHATPLTEHFLWSFC